MKILFFTRRYLPDMGGVETHVSEITKRLVDAGHSVTIVTESSGSSQQSLGDTATGSDRSAGVYRIPIHTSEKLKKFTIWSWLWKHRELIEEADIVHVHDVFFWYLPFRFRYPHKKIYTTFHGYETVYPPKPSAIRQRRLAAQLSLGNIAVGDYIKKWYGTHSDAVTYGGITISKVYDSHPQKSDKLRILFIGRLEPDTGGELYIDLLKHLKTNNVAYSFTAIGDGSLKHIFSRFGDTPGFQKDVTSYIAKADIVFASSYLSMLDAFQQKKLVVALYANPLKHDYLSLSPFAKFAIVESSAAKAFQQMKFYTLNPNRLKTVLHDQYEWVEKQTWDAVVKQYLTLWKK